MIDDDQDSYVLTKHKLAKIPGGPSYGDLRLSPIWDPLRGDARFDKIVASLAPKDAKQ